MKANQDLMMRTWTSRRMAEIDQSVMLMKDLANEIEVFKTNQGTFAKMTDIDRVMNKFREYARADYVKDIKDDFTDFVKSDAFSILQEEMRNVQQAVGGLTNKNETDKKFNVLTFKINTELAERPTYDYTNKKFAAIERKMAYFKEQMSTMTYKLDKNEEEIAAEIS